MQQLLGRPFVPHCRGFRGAQGTPDSPGADSTGGPCKFGCFRVCRHQCSPLRTVAKVPHSTPHMAGVGSTHRPMARKGPWGKRRWRAGENSVSPAKSSCSCKCFFAHSEGCACGRARGTWKEKLRPSAQFFCEAKTLLKINLNWRTKLSTC